MSASVEMSVSESVEAEEDIPDTPSVQQWAEKAYLSDDSVVVSVQIVSADEMRQLNATWRGSDKSTNVLSFPMRTPEVVELKILGDLALCAAVINAEARQQHKMEKAHWAHMLVHGMLHLQGYDHVDDTQAEAMEALEIHILNQLGFSNPYLENADKRLVEQS
ncbi:MAG: rRNA maturation RNase YbeY [Gammaproteobacteria bacterium]|jgi:probable rRNA maturation factor